MPSHSRQRRQPAWWTTSVGSGKTVPSEQLTDAMAATSLDQNLQTNDKFHRGGFQTAAILGASTRVFRSFPASQVSCLHFQPWGSPPIRILSSFLVVGWQQNALMQIKTRLSG